MRSKKTLMLKLSAVLLLVALVFSFTGCLFQGSTAYDEYLDQMFVSVFTDDALSINFMISDPAALGLDGAKAELYRPAASADEYADGFKGLGTLTTMMKYMYSYKKLTDEQKVIYDFINEYFANRAKYADYYYLQDDYIGSYLGFQANLPIYLAEWHFRSVEDIESYFAIMRDTPSAFDAYVTYERDRVENGYGRADFVYIGAIEQCENFAGVSIYNTGVEPIEESFLIPLFAEKIAECTFLTDEQRATYAATNTDVVNNTLLPAYEKLGRDIVPFIGNAKNNQEGMAKYEKGKAYYELLLKDATGTDDSVETVENNIKLAYNNCIDQLNALTAPLYDNWELNYESFLTEGLDNWASKDTLYTILETLETDIASDFPAISQMGEVVLKEVDESLKDNYSPAAHFTSYIDDMNAPQVIILNLYSDSLINYNSYDLLSHEGFPGHLYQDAYLKSIGTPKIMSALGQSSYSEGWATYCEGYSAKYFSTDNPLYNTFYQIYLLENKLSQYIVALSDIWVNYYGYSREQLFETIKNTFYSSSTDMTELRDYTDRLFEHVIEVPTNVLKYYYTELKFQDLKSKYQAKLGDEYTDMKFHTAVQQYGALPIKMYYDLIL